MINHTNIAISEVEEAVRDRYSHGAVTVERGLCCPTGYDPNLLQTIPQEVLERDYGCGDPSRHLRASETVLDLGSGGGRFVSWQARSLGRLDA